MEIAPKPGTVFFFVLLFSIPLVVIYISTQRFQVVRPGIFASGNLNFLKNIRQKLTENELSVILKLLIIYGGKNYELI